MPALPLRYYGDPLLKKKSKPVASAAEVAQLAADMFATMYDAGGVGLAAVQVGELKNLFILNVTRKASENTPGAEEVFINPKILKAYGKDEEAEEGCLSIPDLRENVTRKPLIDLEFTDLDGIRRFEMGISGLKARAVQHEMDHLNGILFVDRLPPARKIVIKKELKRIAKEYAE